MTLLFAGLYLVVVVSFLVPLGLAFHHWRTHQVPLALKFMKLSLAFGAFVGVLFVTYLALEAWPDQSDRIEVFFDSAYFVLYALLTLVFTRLLYELLQKPWLGWRRTVVEGMAWAGLVLVFLVHSLVFDNGDRVVALRWTLNGLYLPVFLGWMLSLFGLALHRLKSVVDPWKKVTLEGSAWIFLATIPLFILDALWPLFQVEWRLIPRGLNLHISGVLVWNVFWAWRWVSFNPHFAELPVQAGASPSEPSSEPEIPPPLAEDLPILAPLTAREREVARWVLAGLPNQAVAQRLGLEVGTVKNHLYHVFNKTGASSRKELKRMVGG